MDEESARKFAEQVKDDDFLVLPCNKEAIEMFLDVSYLWVYSMSGRPTSLDWSNIKARFELEGIRLSSENIRRIIIIETAAITELIEIERKESEEYNG